MSGPAEAAWELWTPGGEENSIRTSMVKQVQRQSQAPKEAFWIVNKWLLSRAETDKFLDYNFISFSKLTKMFAFNVSNLLKKWVKKW